MNIEDCIAENLPKWRSWIVGNGGEWVGVQQGFGDAEPIVLFIPPLFTRPIGLKLSQMTEDNVKEKLGVKTKQTVSDLTRINFTGLEAKLRAQLTPVRELLREFLAAIDKLEEELKNAEK